jgi:hypothetical protein
MTKPDLRTLHPTFFGDDPITANRAIHKWAVENFTPTTYHKPEFYLRSLVEYIKRRDINTATPEFDQHHHARLSTIKRELSHTECSNRLHLIHQRHQLESIRDTKRYTSGMEFGALIELNRARSYLNQINIDYINDLLTYPEPITVYNKNNQKVLIL